MKLGLILISFALSACSSEFDWGQLKSGGGNADSPNDGRFQMAVVGDGGNSFTISWDPAHFGDEYTGSILYKLAFLPTEPPANYENAIDKLPEVHVLMNWTEGVTEYLAADINIGTYYFMVVAKNEDDQRIAYEIQSYTVDPESSSNLVYSGNYLKPPGASLSHYFGDAVAIDGDRLYVGHSDTFGSQGGVVHGIDFSGVVSSGVSSGAVHVYRAEQGKWYHEAKLSPPNGHNDQRSGVAVAASGDTLVVGSYDKSNTSAIIHGSDLSSTNTDGTRVGAVFVYRRTGTEWKFEAYLKAPNPSDDDRFGSAVGIDGDVIVVGAWGEDSDTNQIISSNDLSATNNNGGQNGAAYVYRRTGSTWAFEAYLKAPNSDVENKFGINVAISGDTIAVGAPGEKSSTNAIIHGNDLSATNQGQLNTGAVYVFRKTGATWEHKAYLKPPRTDVTRGLGQTIALDGDTIAAGAELDNSSRTTVLNGNDHTALVAGPAGDHHGAVLIYKRTAGTWAVESYLKAPKDTLGSLFAQNSLALSGDLVAVSAYREESLTNTIIAGSDLSSTNSDGDAVGAVYVYERSGANWAHKTYVKPAVVYNGLWFGWKVAVSGSGLLVGAKMEQSSQSYGTAIEDSTQDWPGHGAAYYFDLEN